MSSNILQHFINKYPSVGDIKIFSNNLVAAEHKHTDKVKVIQKVQKPKGRVKARDAMDLITLSLKAEQRYVNSSRSLVSRISASKTQKVTIIELNNRQVP